MALLVPDSSMQRLWSSKNSFFKTCAIFFSQEKSCHLMLYLHLMDPHCDLAYHMTLILINFKSTQMFFPCLKSILQRIFCPPDEVPNLVSLSWLKQFVKVLSRTSDTHFQFRIFYFLFSQVEFQLQRNKSKKKNLRNHFSLDIVSNRHPPPPTYDWKRKNWTPEFQETAFDIQGTVLDSKADRSLLMS